MCSKLLSFLVSVLLCRNLVFLGHCWCTCVPCVSSTVVRNYDDDDDENDRERD